MAVRTLVLLALVVALAACKENYDDQVARIEKVVAGKPVGSGADFWLVKGSFGVDDKVALVFGYMDDGGGCIEIAELLNERYPSARYTCTSAN
ncbi:MAG: hypothetical protein CMI62_02375 [Parvibaculum sp.]|jgi:hypothetical protein|uniref:hypothetical protein n=1 Tax=Parvibaculum sp. TaxID=2024848 RepID=UPI000C437524|nr:hypothetical protein [Parvibaculum sp.]MAU59557.1 hypothetical protein [Parvibaculum sp.]|tara:strand:- start:7961 stop:8239 length:279 start_codon:yes stop_codon:yes gene_type:complete